METSLNSCQREMTAMTVMHLSQWTQQNIVESYLHFYVCFNTWHRLSDFKAAACHTFWPESCKISCFTTNLNIFWRNMFWVKRSANLIALFNTFMASMEVIIKHPICCLWNCECSSYETAEVQILQNTRQRQSSFQNKNGKWIMRSYLWLLWRSQKLSVCWSINGRLVRQYICDDRAEQV